MAQVTYTLDACALIAYFRGEEGSERLASMFAPIELPEVAEQVLRTASD